MLVHHLTINDHGSSHEFVEIPGLTEKAAYAFLGFKKYPTDSIEIDQAKALMILKASNEKPWSYTTHIFLQVYPHRKERQNA